MLSPTDIKPFPNTDVIRDQIWNPPQLKTNLERKGTPVTYSASPFSDKCVAVKNGAGLGSPSKDSSRQVQLYQLSKGFYLNRSHIPQRISNRVGDDVAGVGNVVIK